MFLQSHFCFQIFCTIFPLPTQIIVFYFTFYLQAVKTNDYQCIDVIGKDLYISRVWMRRTGFYPFLLILLYKKIRTLFPWQLFLSIKISMNYMKFKTGYKWSCWCYWQSKLVKTRTSPLLEALVWVSERSVNTCNLQLSAKFSSELY